MKLKLFVWEEVLTDYSHGIMFALAENVDQARKILIEKESEPTEFIEQELQDEPKIIESPEGFILWGGA